MKLPKFTTISFSRIASKWGDPTIHTVLDQIMHVAHLDPESFAPDQNFIRDLGLKPRQIKLILLRSARILNHRLSFSAKFPDFRLDELTPRRLVNILKSLDKSAPLDC